MPKYVDPNYTGKSRAASQSRKTAEDTPVEQPQPQPTPASKGRGEERRKVKTKKRTDSRPAIVRFFADRRLHGIIGVILILMSVYSLIAVISYMTHGDADQSLVGNLTMDQMTVKHQEVRNIGGPLGAFIAETLVAKWLGVGALVVIFYFLLLGLALIKVKKCNFWSLTFRSLVLTIGLSIILGGITSPFPLGGDHGYYINMVLNATMGELGRYIVLLLVGCVIVYVYLNDLIRLHQAYRRTAEARRERREIEEAEKALKRAKAAQEGKDDEEEEEEEPEEEIDTPQPGQDEHPDDPNPDRNFNDIIDETERIFDEEDAQSRERKAKGATVPVEDTTPKASFEISAPKIEVAKVIKPPVNPDEYDHRADLSRYRFPSIDLLIDRPVKNNIVDLEEQEENKERITKTLNDYQIAIQSIEATVGPTVTLYEIVPAEGVRIAKIKRLEDDIALSLAALGIRIIAPIPGKGTIGIEVPNKDPQTVSIRSILSSQKFQNCNYALPMAMGVTIANEVYIADLTKMPHLLVAGATGQGKSVGLNTIIASLLYKKHPSELKFVLIDPKMVEFSLYSKLERHYLAKLPDEEDAIITDPAKVVATLNSLCVEMDNRYALLRDANVRSLAEYNAKFTARKLNPEKGHRYMPYIVMIVDEFADLIMTAGKEVETPIARIAQKARAVGMHMIIATQRPSTNVITGIIKANFPGRIAFRVQQMVDSKTILDRTGANQLIGRGDMLFSINGDMTRVQCAFIDTPEVVAICDCIDDQLGYEHAYFLPEFIPENDGSAGMNGISDTDSLFEEAARAIVQSGVASTSSLQRRYSIGYNRAGKIMDQLEAAGIVGPAMGGKPRAILVDSLALERIIEANVR